MASARTGVTWRMLLLAALAGGAGPLFAAETFPNRPVRLIIPYAPGGATDITARQLQGKLAELWGQPVKR